MQESLVSVVMPTYNHAQFIKEAIKSVLDQSYQNIELIIVDNYSKDETELVIKGFQDSRIKYIKFSNNGVIAASRNQGIKSAVGEFIAFIDSDDAWCDDKIKLQVEAMQQDDEYGLSYGLFKVTSPDPVQNGQIRGPKDKILGDKIYEQLINANFVVSSSVLVRAQALKEVGMFTEDPALIAAEDYDLWLRLAYRFKCVFIPEVVGLYREHQTNTSDDGKIMQRVVLIVDDQLKQGRITQQQADRSKSNFYFHVGWALIDNNAIQARQFFTKAIKFGKLNIKVLCVSFIGFTLSFIPSLFRYIKNRRLDKQVARRIMNPQNL